MRTAPRTCVTLLSALSMLAGILILGPAPGRAAEVPGASSTAGATAPAVRPRAETAGDTVVVKFRGGTSGPERDRALAARGLRRRSEIPAIGYTVVETAGRSPAATARDLRADPAVEVAEPNYLRRIARTPNDPQYPTNQGYLPGIRMPQAWDVTLGSTSYDIAFLDTGVDLDHPDLAATRLKAGYDFVNDDAVPQDDHGHGTTVAGIGAAVTNNSRGVAGVAWRGGIVPVKVLGPSGAGDDATIAEGIAWATDRGVQVINLSAGGYGESRLLEDAVGYALSHDVVVVAAAGNLGSSVPFYPAAIPGVVAVGTTDSSGVFAWFSNWGSWVDVVAPGIGIRGPKLAAGAQNLYRTDSGTSMSAPIVSGVALLVRHRNPSWTHAQVAGRLRSSARDFGPRGIDLSYGWGRIDAFAALGAARLAPAAVPARDSLEPDGTLDAANPMPASSTSATISPEGDVDWFVKTVTAPGSVTFTVTPPAPSQDTQRTREFDPVLEVYGPSLQPLRRVDEAPVGSPETVTVGATAGAHYLKVSNYLGSRSPGSYTVTATTSTTATSFSFAAPRLHESGAGTGSSATVGDFTGDGRADAVVTKEEPELAVFSHDPFGRLQLVQTVELDGAPRAERGAAAGDLDGDGDADLAAAASGGVDVLYQEDGLLTGPDLVETADPVWQVRIADVNADGRNDIVASTSGGIVLLRGSATGFQPTTLSSEFPLEVEVADLTSDGRLDVASIADTGSSSVLHVYVQLPGNLFVQTSYTAVGAGENARARALAVGDVTGDGRTDAIVSVTDPPSLNVFAQRATGTLDAPIVRGTGTVDAIEAADVDGDGRTDLALLYTNEREVGVMLQGTGGTLSNPTDAELAPTLGDTAHPTGLAVGDVTGDGALDLAVSRDAELAVLPQPERAPLLWARATDPADFATGTSRSIDPRVTFVRALEPASVTGATASVRNGVTWTTVGATRRYDAVTGTLTLDLSGTRSAGTPYVVLLEGLRDSGGNVMPPMSFRFTTGA